jgi:hypothetical protein
MATATAGTSSSSRAAFPDAAAEPAIATTGQAGDGTLSATPATGRCRAGLPQSRSWQCSPAIGRTSMVPYQAVGCLDAISMASSRSEQSITS